MAAQRLMRSRIQKYRTARAELVEALRGACTSTGSVRTGFYTIERESVSRQAGVDRHAALAQRSGGHAAHQGRLQRRAAARGHRQHRIGPTAHELGKIPILTGLDDSLKAKRIGL